MKKYLLFIVIFMVVPWHTFAAGIFFGAPGKTVPLQGLFEVGVFLDTQKEPVNAVEGTIIFPVDTLELEGFYTGNSVLTFWIEQPRLVAAGKISFAGIVPGGFTGEKGYLFSIVFKPRQEGLVEIRAELERIMLHNGIGTEAALAKAPLVVTVSGNDTSELFVPLDDTVPPEIFSPQVSRDPGIFEGKYFLAFSTQDKGSGVDYYEVMEVSPWWSWQRWLKKKQWVRADSPYLLQDQSLQSDVWVKAVDGAGNEQVAHVVLSQRAPWRGVYFIGMIMVVAIIGWALWKFFLKKTQS